MIKASEMPINANGSVYHLNLLPKELAQNVILVGDPGRVPNVSQCFDEIEVKKQNREIVVHTGIYKNKRITVLSTGMGTDNIDIVMNELDALANIDLQKRIVKEEHTSLNLLRLGTCGGLQADIATNSYIASQYSIGLDGLLHYYQHDKSIRQPEIEKTFAELTQWGNEFPHPYAVAASDEMMQKLAFDMKKGITLTASGFYAPQCRVLRHELAMPDFAEKISGKYYHDVPFTNMEMETSALYGLSKIMGHNALTICVMIANRVNKTFSEDYHPAMNNLIHIALERI
jgi:uridine phosphorylase